MGIRPNADSYILQKSNGREEEVNMPGRKKIAAYAQIYNRIRNGIFSGKLQPGSALPSESQLCKEYDVSRETARKALVMLENEHLIFSRPKIGYFVSAQNQEEITLQETEGLSLKYKDVTGIFPDEKLQEILGAAPDQRVIVFSQLLIDNNNEPVAYEKKYVPYKKAYPSVESEMRYAVLPDMTLSKVASFDYYTKILISAVNADRETADALKCELNEPIILTEQFYTLQNGNVIGYSKQYRSPKAKLSGISGLKK